MDLENYYFGTMQNGLSEIEIELGDAGNMWSVYILLNPADSWMLVLQWQKSTP